MKFDAELIVPAAAITVNGPDAAPDGIVTVICVGEFTVNEAFFPVIVTELTLLKPDPEIITEVPMGPLVGEKLVIDGKTINCVALVTEPFVVVTEIDPVVAVDGTDALI